MCYNKIIIIPCHILLIFTNPCSMLLIVILIIDWKTMYVHDVGNKEMKKEQLNDHLYKNGFNSYNTTQHIYSPFLTSDFP